MCDPTPRIVSKSRYVAFLDILGFEDLTNTRPLSEVSGLIERCLVDAEVATDRVYNAPTGHRRLIPPARVSFSDTFVLTSEDVSTAEQDEDAIFGFFVGLTFFVRYLFASGLPIRGAVTYGEADFVMTTVAQIGNPPAVRERTTHVLGKAVNRAYRLEGRQDWAGVMIDPINFPERARALITSPYFSPLFVEYKVPLKSPYPTEEPLLALNWRYNLDIDRVSQAFFPPTNCSLAEAKIARTVEFAREMEKAEKHRGEGRTFHTWLNEKIPIG